ncbi:MAG: hypothetical protein IPJ13_00735 [Saprospiraceae bacterium]|nr:hypothetical protein [Saprospiraceae bacterium]
MTPDYKNVLMICSLKAYKGVNEYLQLAKKNPEYAFRLVVNASAMDIEGYFSGQNLPQKLNDISTQKMYIHNINGLMWSLICLVLMDG